MATTGLLVKLIAVALSLQMCPLAVHAIPKPTHKVRLRQVLEDAEETAGRVNSGGRSSEERTHRGYDGGAIIYPDAKVTPKCVHGLCYNTVGYPNAKIKKILSKSQFMNEYFNSEEFVDVEINNRFNSDEIPLCETKLNTIYPERANNTMKMEKVIVNVEGHKQGIVFETCVSTGKCKFSNTFPDMYTSFCKQKYVHKRLMVLGDNDKFVFDTFEVPSCCVCTVKNSG